MKAFYMFGKMRFTGGKDLYRITGWNVNQLVDRAVLLIKMGDKIHTPLKNAGLSGFQIILEDN